ncbi:MAG: glycosyltransferase [Steroidobacteraceae bacterium]
MPDIHDNPRAARPGCGGSAALRILMVAPQPFFRPRGTPFSVLHRIRALIALGHQVDLITYPFGEDVAMPGLTILRSARVPLVRDVKIGPSFSKLLLDIPLFFATLKALRSRHYDLVHSHEEAAFFCAPLTRKFGLIHVYDMHSSLPQQLDNFKSFNFGPIRKVFSTLENHVLSTCDGVITICQDLAEVALPRCTDKPHAMIENTGDDAMVFGDTKPADGAEIMDFTDHRVVLYTGTFEAYQGLDLLLDAFALVRPKIDRVQLVLVGGRPHQVEAYRAKAQALGIDAFTAFVGQVHPSQIPHYIKASELIVSPRSSGTNTPLKIYGYLRSGRPIVATNLYTHTQTLNPQVAELVPPTAEDLAAGILKVLNDSTYAQLLSDAARRLSDAEYSDAAYLRKMTDFYARIMEHAGMSAPHDTLPGESRARA